MFLDINRELSDISALFDLVQRGLFIRLYDTVVSRTQFTFLVCVVLITRTHRDAVHGIHLIISN